MFALVYQVTTHRQNSMIPSLHCNNIYRKAGAREDKAAAALAVPLAIVYMN
jgi:hypothetical protein